MAGWSYGLVQLVCHSSAWSGRSRFIFKNKYAAVRRLKCIHHALCAFLCLILSFLFHFVARSWLAILITKHPNIKLDFLIKIFANLLNSKIKRMGLRLSQRSEAFDQTFEYGIGPSGSLVSTGSKTPSMSWITFKTKCSKEVCGKAYFQSMINSSERFLESCVSMGQSPPSRNQRARKLTYF